MSDTNRVGLRIARNPNRTPPLTVTSLTQLRYTGTPGLAFAPRSILSEEIRDDRQITDSILVGASAGGNANFELSYGTFDLLLESLMLNTWVDTPSKLGATEVAAIGAGTVTLNSGTGFITGMIVRFTHTDANGSVYDNAYSIAVAGAVLTLTGLYGAPAVTAGTPNAASSVKVCGFRAVANGNISVSVGSGVATFTCPAGFLPNAMGSALPLVPGQWIKAAVFGTAANNIAYRVLTVGATTFTAVAQTGVATDTAAAARVELYYGDYIRNGSALLSGHQFAIERRFADHSPVTRELFTGMAVSQMQLTLGAQAIASGQFTFLGFNSKVSNSSPNYTDLYSSLPTDVASNANEVYNTSTNVGRLALGANDIVSSTNNLVLEATITINNNLRERPAVGVFGASSIGVGQISVSGNLNTYFDDKTILDLILNNTSTEYNILVKNSDGRSLLFDLPRVKLTSGSPEVAGGNQDVVLNPDIQGLRHPTLGYTVHFQRWPFIQ